MKPFVDALERSEKIITLLLQATNDFEQITNDSLLDDDEKVGQIRERLDRLKKNLATS
jgi:hypothetical protein